MAKAGKKITGKFCRSSWQNRFPAARTSLTSMTLAILLLGDPHAACADVMTFWQAVDTAQARNPQIHRAEALLRAAREDNPKTFAKLLPLVNVKALDVLRQGNHYAKLGTQQHSDPKSLTLTVDQRILDLPAMTDHFQSGIHIEAAYADAMAMRQDITLRVATVTSNWLEAREVLDLAIQYKKITGKHVHENKIRLDAGEGTKTDLEQASSRFNQAEASYQDALNTMEKEAAFFREVVGIDPDPALSLPDYAWKEPENLEQSLWKWIEDRPEIWAARARQKESTISENMARQEHMPKVNFNYTASRTWDSELGGSSGRSIKDEENAHSVSLAINMPIFSGFETLAKTREARALKEAAIAELDRVRALAKREVEEARYDLKNNKAAIRSLEKALEFSQQAATGLEESFHAGTRTLLDLLDSQFEVHTLRTNLVRHRYQAQLALMRLWKGLGRLVHPTAPARPNTHEESTLSAKAGRDETIDMVNEQMLVAMQALDATTTQAPDETDEALLLLWNTLNDQARPLAELHAGRQAPKPQARAMPWRFNPTSHPFPKQLPATSETGAFMVHVGTFTEEKRLTAMIRTLVDLGIPSWSEPIISPDEKAMTRLLVGPFTSHADLQTAMAVINRQTGQAVGWLPVSNQRNADGIRLHLHDKPLARLTPPDR
ncbi:MAG: TolC family protein [Magnetococcales bacterium]|nr:TolC family protein [Magnetococcales bacterium]